MDISGETELYAIIGDPIRQAKTPSLLNPLIAKAGVKAVVVPIHIPQAQFDVCIDGLMALGNLKGLIITYPFKERAMQRAARTTERARAIGGINAMRREDDGSWTGDIFDGDGLLNAVKPKVEISGSRVLLIGAGGAGRAIGVAFAQQGASQLTVYDIDTARAKALVDAVGSLDCGCSARLGSPIAAGHTIIVNATPIGMKAEDVLPADIGTIDAGATVVDIVPRLDPTPLMQKAVAEGALAIAGKAMTEGQALALLDFFKLVPLK